MTLYSIRFMEQVLCVVAHGCPYNTAVLGILSPVEQSNAERTNFVICAVEAVVWRQDRIYAAPSNLNHGGVDPNLSASPLSFPRSLVHTK